MKSESQIKPGAYVALALLLGINLFNYVDRYILAAVEPEIRATFFAADDRNAMAVNGLLGTAFFVTYMLSAPALGWLSDRFSRWLIIGSAVLLWSLASGASGLAATFSLLVFTRILVGIGEGGYGPAGPTILADLFPRAIRGRILSIFCAAIPVGGALGYVLGSVINTHLGWRWAFYLVTPPGLLLGLLCFTQRDPRARETERKARDRATWDDFLTLLRTHSYVINCFAQTAMTFAFGGLAFWMSAYLRYRSEPASATAIFGAITALAGLLSTLTGGVVADRLQRHYAGSYFLVSGIGMLIAAPLFVAMLFTPFPAAWGFLFGAVFFGFLNTGPSNTALANVAFPNVRATAFALNILVIHALGDALAFPAIGYISGHSTMNIGFLVISGMMLIAGVIWLAGIKSLGPDTLRVEGVPAPSPL
ncbi:MAG TPA: MFS transporter [Chthoniobacterales bacterium]|nr:MFS transporter [Chthoniobacterales bacterium]